MATESSDTHGEKRSPPAFVDRLTRRVFPRLVVSLSELDGIAQIAAAARRGTGRRGRVELFFAFDDPCSAIAVIDLAARVADRDVLLLMLPVVRRGIPDDPAVDLKREFAVADAWRLGRRTGLVLSRDGVLTADDTAFLAAWVASAAQGRALIGFCVAACERLWLHSSGAVERAPYEALWREHVGGDPPPDAGDADVRGNEKLMARRKPYDTPAAWVHGQWFFAHDRLEQIGDRLDDLGWTVKA